MMTKKQVTMPKFENESQEADWWASAEGRLYVKQRVGENKVKGQAPKGSPLLAKMLKEGSVQIALRLPKEDLAAARKIAERKGIGYQTLIKMMVHEGLARESR